MLWRPARLLRAFALRTLETPSAHAIASRLDVPSLEAACCKVSTCRSVTASRVALRREALPRSPRIFATALLDVDSLQAFCNVSMARPAHAVEFRACLCSCACAQLAPRSPLLLAVTGARISRSGCRKAWPFMWNNASLCHGPFFNNGLRSRSHGAKLVGWCPQWRFLRSMSLLQHYCAQLAVIRRRAATSWPFHH